MPLPVLQSWREPPPFSAEPGEAVAAGRSSAPSLSSAPRSSPTHSLPPAPLSRLAVCACGARDVPHVLHHLAPGARLHLCAGPLALLVPLAHVQGECCFEEGGVGCVEGGEGRGGDLREGVRRSAGSTSWAGATSLTVVENLIRLPSIHRMRTSYSREDELSPLFSISSISSLAGGTAGTGQGVSARSSRTRGARRRTPLVREPDGPALAGCDGALEAAAEAGQKDLRVYAVRGHGC